VAFTHSLAGVAVEEVKMPASPGSFARDIYFSLNLGGGIDIKIGADGSVSSSSDRLEILSG